jgi:GAF domain-containing protein
MSSGPGTASPADVLAGLCRELVDEVGGSACAISRIIGELLVQVAEDSGPRDSLQLGGGYMIPDYPLTAEVIRNRVARTVSLRDPDPDPGEVAVLEALGFESVLMLPLALDDEPWGLVELYGAAGRRFDADDAVRSAGIVARAAGALEGLRARRTSG